MKLWIIGGVLSVVGILLAGVGIITMQITHRVMMAKIERRSGDNHSLPIVAVRDTWIAGTQGDEQKVTDIEEALDQEFGREYLRQAQQARDYALMELQP